MDESEAGGPAVTRHAAGRGNAWYVSTCLAEDGLDAVPRAASEDAALTSRDLPRDVEVVERAGTAGRYLFAINHTEEDATVPVAGPGVELLTGDGVDGHVRVPAGEVRVVHTPVR